MGKLFSWLFSNKRREEAKRKADIIKQAAMKVLEEEDEEINSVKPFDDQGGVRTESNGP